MNKVYGVVFRGNKKRYYYRCEEEYHLEEFVVIKTEKGEYLGKVVQVLDDAKDVSNDVIERLASDMDYSHYLSNLKDEDRAYKKCLKLVDDLGLEMHVINAKFNLDRSQLIFNFVADGRVDFRELARSLAGIFHTRIELHQVGARDKAKCIGGVGICGGELCCVRFLNKTDTINMNMAKNQNLALNPSKINGACGRLLCCLQYEDQTYLDALKKLPSVGDTIKTPKGEAEVISVDILGHKGTILIDGEKCEYDFFSKE